MEIILLFTYFSIKSKQSLNRRDDICVRDCVLLRIFFRCVAKQRVFAIKMSADTVPSTSSNGGTRSQSSTEMMDQSDYIYMIPEQERINICYYLNEIWEDAAKKMGYTQSDIIVS